MWQVSTGSELDLVVEGSNLWFYNKLSLEDHSIEPVPRVVQSTGTFLHVKIDEDCSSNLRSLTDGDTITIAFHTHFSTRWEMDIECHTKVL